MDAARREHPPAAIRRFAADAFYDDSRRIHPLNCPVFRPRSVQTQVLTRKTLLQNGTSLASNERPRFESLMSSVARDFFMDLTRTTVSQVLCASAKTLTAIFEHLRYEGHLVEASILVERLEDLLFAPRVHIQRPCGLENDP
jgi:hypothetical protein